MNSSRLLVDLHRAYFQRGPPQELRAYQQLQHAGHVCACMGKRRLHGLQASNHLQIQCFPANLWALLLLAGTQRAPKSLFHDMIAG